MIVCDGLVAGRRLRREDALHHRAQQRRRRPLARDVAEREAQRSVAHFDVIVEVAADRPARQRRRRGAEVAAGPRRLREQRLLDLRGDPHLLLHPRLLHRLAVEAGVLDGDRGFGRQRFERGARRSRQQRPLLLAVEIQDADAPLLAHVLGLVDVAHQAQRNAQDVADAERDGAHVHVGEIAVEQVGDDARFAGAEDFLGNLPAGREAAAGQRDVAAAARHLEFEIHALERQHDEAALRAADLDRRIQHQRQHVVEDPARAERAQAFEQRGDLAQVADRGGRRPVDRRLRIGEQEDHLGAAGAAETDLVAVHQHAFGHLFAVHVGAVARVAVVQRETVAVDGDFGVVARDFAAGQPQIVGLAAADLERTLGDRDDAPSERVGDFETGVGHGLTV